MMPLQKKNSGTMDEVKLNYALMSAETRVGAQLGQAATTRPSGVHRAHSLSAVSRNPSALIKPQPT